MRKRISENYGICHLSLVPCRAEPSDKSEMINQLLFGDCFLVKEIRKNWIRIELLADKYEGWIDSKQYMEISQKEALEISKTTVLNGDLVALLKNVESNQFQTLVLGSSLPHYNKQNIIFANNQFEFKGLLCEIKKNRGRAYLIETAQLYLNAPYLWGGRSPFGIDCSGFTQMIYKFYGISLPRDAWQQAELGQSLSFIEESDAGDLAFFDNQEGHIIHVGMLLGNNEIIHASGKVRIDKIDHQGIFNTESRSYSHKLRLIKKLLP